MSEQTIFEEMAEHIRAESPVALATVVEGPNVGGKLLVTLETSNGTLGDEDLDRVVARDVLGELAAGRNGIRRYGPQGQAREEDVAVFIESFAPPPQMVIFGAVDFTAALVKVSKFLGYRVTVCDARPIFATTQRFPLANEVVVDWPDRLLERIGPDLQVRDAVAVLTHDNKFDVPAITSALKTNVGYICLLYTSPSPRDKRQSRMPSSA